MFGLGKEEKEAWGVLRRSVREEEKRDKPVEEYKEEEVAVEAN